MTKANGWGLASISLETGKTLDTWYPAPKLGEGLERDKEACGIVELVQAKGEFKIDSLDATKYGLKMLNNLQNVDDMRGIKRVLVFREVDLDEAPSDASDVYLRLHLLSHCLVEPNAVNLDNIYAILENVVWTNFGPCAVEGFEFTRAAIELSGRGNVTVWSVDKFPRMVDYVVPLGVRIGNANRIRLGAHLAPGTTVMHEGFCNFNAGTLGTSMVEGRISQGVIVEDGADIGGGASIMGTLSGGGKEKVRIGARSLLGANAGIGISLGEDCIVEAGLYVTAASKLTLIELDKSETSVKALELNGQSNLLYIRNSVTGRVEARRRQPKVAGVTLNSALHA